MSNAFVGIAVPGVQTTGVKKPQYVYRGDAIVNPDEIYALLSTAPRDQSFKCKIKKGAEGGASSYLQKSAADAEIEITAGNTTGSVTGLDNFTVSDKDYFEAEVTQVGTSPNEGSDLVCLVTR